MKAVIFVLFAALVAVNAQTYQECSRTPQYQEKIDPISCPTPTVKLPNYENAQTYYQCAKGVSSFTSTLNTCPNGQYFSYVMQNCQPCATYLPTAHCESLPFNASCVAMADEPTTTSSTTTTTTTTTTVAPGSSTSTTLAPSSDNTTSSVPMPPTESPSDGSTTTNSDGILTPSGTTINVPQPPSPGDSNVPAPQTPIPTAPIINNGPPVVTEAPIAK